MCLLNAHSSRPGHRCGLRGRGGGFENNKIIHFLFDFYIFLKIAVEPHLAIVRGRPSYVMLKNISISTE